MVEAMPVALLYEGQRLAIAILSYRGNINFGYLADGDAVADLDELGRCMERSLQELLNVARSARSDDEPVETRRKVAALV
jgi:hypothetical protein